MNIGDFWFCEFLIFFESEVMRQFGIQIVNIDNFLFVIFVSNFFLVFHEIEVLKQFGSTKLHLFSI